MQRPTDSQLIARYLKGDPHAFGELVNRYQNLVYNLTLRLTGNKAEAEDLSQEVFIRLMNKIGSFRGEAKFSTWLYRLTANYCRDWLRRRRFNSLPLEEGKLPVDSDPIEQAETLDLGNHIVKALSQLPIDYRLVVVLRDIQGLSYQEIAASLKISLGTVKSRLSRGRSLLAKMLQPVWEQNKQIIHQKNEGKNGLSRSKKPII
jgi:RNA polymerase sigma-70 factor (ECF subfamily)